MSDQPNQQGADASAHDASQLEGAELSMDSPEQRSTALRQAVDYRGDVTLHLHDGRSVVGYIYDLRPPQPSDGEPTVRLMSPEGGRENIPAAEIARLAFTGRDTAAGKSFETWVKKYVKQKLNEQQD